MSQPEPAWLRALVLALAAGVASFGLIGLTLAVLGWYHPWAVFTLGALGTGALVALGWSFVGGPRAPARAQAIAAIGLAAIACVTVWNMTNASQHVLVNRDGGSYANTGRWIAGNGNLRVPAARPPFANEKSLVYDSFAVFERPDGSLDFQFAHLLPALLAEAHSIGGDGALFHLPELLAGFALTAFFLLAWRLFRRGWFALAATLCFAFLIPEVSFARDSYSEIPMQIFVFSALALLVGSRRFPRPRVAFVAGVLLGATQATRIDGLALLIGVPALLAYWWVASGDRQRRVSIGAPVAGLVPGIVIGFVDVVGHSRAYFDAEWKNIRLLVLGVVAVAFASVVVVAVRKYTAGAGRVVRSQKFAVAAGVVVGAIGFAAWFIRPHVQHFELRNTPAYYERSVEWMSWYLGPVTLAVAIVGAGLLVWSLLRSGSQRAVPPLLVLVPPSVIYLWRAQALPDHVWVDRRFLVNATPLLLLLAFGVVAAIAPVRARSTSDRAVTVVACLFVACAIAYPVWTLRGISTMSEQRGSLAVVNDACRMMGDRPVVVVLGTPHGLFDQWSPQTFRGWCGAEVAILREPDGATLRRIAADWQALGRSTYVVADAAPTIGAVLPEVKVSTTRTVKANRLERTLTSRPTHLGEQSITIAIARVPTT